LAVANHGAHIELDSEDREWATDMVELDKRWRLHIKNQVLSLRLAEKEGRVNCAPRTRSSPWPRVRTATSKM
jgi:hypothetical protein